MIYEEADPGSPIRQGDIFRDIPRVDFSLKTVAAVDKEGRDHLTSWRGLIENDHRQDVIMATVAVKPVHAISISQNCDASRGEFISLCQIDEFSITTHKKPPTRPVKWKNIIIRQAKEETRFFYLPECQSIGLNQRMAADLRLILRVPRIDLESMLHLRIGRLNKEATEHFRENLAQFFRRYPYNEWYPLTKAEYTEYLKDNSPEAKPYPWHK